MTTNDPATIAALDALEADIPAILSAYGEDDFCCAFADRADPILEAACEDRDYVSGRINAMLKEAGQETGG